ncbi:hypothetical protein GCM10028803_43280 [Larkinella knui]|uniref:DUF5655 domain-containing protein n=1 Tax=Larkinella knui TaxID=2025310 RepID=A0A3P1CNR8_9BACT|nr:DUF5655 domain-containing protein [Larkinella knui]RRB14952.1 hypothetical protein EHT87_10330 [Larkinella knui]
MWTCPRCNQPFRHTNQRHSCNDRTVDDFLRGQSAHTVERFHAFIECYKTIGDFVLHPAKSRIGLAHQTRFCSINQLGKDYIDVFFQFDKPYTESFLFHKIGQLPNSKLHNHHSRIYSKADLTDELMRFMKMAYLRKKRNIGCWLPALGYPG